MKGPDGYNYEPLWINPKDAAIRGIEDGDVDKVYTERGAVLGGANVTERVICTLTGDSGPFMTKTDGFGDFWFEDLKVSTFSLKIERTGFASSTITETNTEKDINLNDIPLLMV